MKKTVLYAIIILLLIMITVGGTYAFITSRISNDDFNANASKLDITYSKGKEIDGDLSLVTSKEQGFNTTINIGITDESVPVKANVFINIERISEKIATDALIWEVYKVENGSETYVSDGTFGRCKNEDGTNRKCIDGDKLYIVENYPLSINTASLKVYIWLNGNIADNEVIGSELTAYIGAESEKITSNFE